MALDQAGLGRAVGCTRSAVSHVECGRNGAARHFWEVADKLCHCDGELLAAYEALAEAERAYRMNAQQAGQARAQAELTVLQASVGPRMVWLRDDVPDRELVAASGEVAQQLVQLLTRLAGRMDRREFGKVLKWALTAVGAADVIGLDTDEYERVALAIVSPGRVDARVIDNMAAMLSHCKRQEDALGPGAVLGTVLAQHRLLSGLVTGCPDRLRPRVLALSSAMGCAIGGYHIDLGDHEEAQRYLRAARVASHEVGDVPGACYATCSRSNLAYLAGDTPTALDLSAAARSLAARSQDVQLIALSEQMAAAAYALDGDYDRCMAASGRARERLEGTAPDPRSPVYWVHAGMLDSQLCAYLLTLDKPEQAVAAASAALQRFDTSYVGAYARCQVRLGTALVACGDISEAVRVLGNAASLATQSPSGRLTSDLRTARARMGPWQHTQAVKTLDAQLDASALFPRRP